MPRASLPLAVAASLACVTVVAFPQASGAPAGPAAKPGGEQTAQPKRRRVVSDLSGFELLDAAKLKKKPVVTGAGRGLAGEPPLVLAPNLARLHGRSPVFRWQAAAKGQRFLFVLSDGTEKELHRAEVTGDAYTWPTGAARLEDGQTYYWTVEGLLPAATARSSPHGVEVVTSPQRQAVDAALKAGSGGDAYESALARAQVLTDQRLWYDAISACTDLIARYPDRAEAYEMRGTIYAQIPATQALADADFARADAIPAKP